MAAPSTQLPYRRPAVGPSDCRARTSAPLLAAVLTAVFCGHTGSSEMKAAMRVCGSWAVVPGVGSRCDRGWEEARPSGQRPLSRRDPVPAQCDRCREPGGEAAAPATGRRAPRTRVLP